MGYPGISSGDPLTLQRLRRFRKIPGEVGAVAARDRQPHQESCEPRSARSHEESGERDLEILVSLC